MTFHIHTPNTREAVSSGRIPVAGESRTIIIDGQSGSGKTTVAAALSEYMGIPVLHLDSWYPGWHGLAAGTRIAEELLSGARTSYTSWDWSNNRPGHTVHVELGDAWILEGCGALTPFTSSVAKHRIWVEASGGEAAAQKRALARDGATYLPWWDTWHSQELAHWEQHHPRDLADLVITTVDE